MGPSVDPPEPGGVGVQEAAKPEHVDEDLKEERQIIPQLFQQLHGATWFTRLELRGTVVQEAKKKPTEEQWKAAFGLVLTEKTTYKPFLTGAAPRIPQRVMHIILRDLLGNSVLSHGNEVVVYSMSQEAHLRHIRQVLVRFRHNRVYCYLDRSQFHQHTVEFMGFVLTPRGVKLNKSVVKTVRDYPMPISKETLQSMMELMSPYSHFVERFAGITEPLRRQLLTPNPFHWGDEEQEAFESVKRAFRKAPLLYHPRQRKQFYLDSGISMGALYASLIQYDEQTGKRVFCAFFSRDLSPEEVAAPPLTMKSVAIRAALDVWVYYLESTEEPIMILINTEDLASLNNDRLTVVLPGQWAKFFGRFNFGVMERPDQDGSSSQPVQRPDHGPFRARPASQPRAPTRSRTGARARSGARARAAAARTRTATRARAATRGRSDTRAHTATQTCTVTQAHTATQAHADARAHAATQTRTVTQAHTDTQTHTVTRADTATQAQADAEANHPARADTATQTPTVTRADTATQAHAGTGTNNPGRAHAAMPANNPARADTATQAHADARAHSATQTQRVPRADTATQANAGTGTNNPARLRTAMWANHAIRARPAPQARPAPRAYTTTWPQGPVIRERSLRDLLPALGEQREAEQAPAQEEPRRQTPPPEALTPAQLDQILGYLLVHLNMDQLRSLFRHFFRNLHISRDALAPIATLTILRMRQHLPLLPAPALDVARLPATRSLRLILDSSLLTDRGITTAIIQLLAQMAPLMGTVTIRTEEQGQQRALMPRGSRALHLPPEFWVMLCERFSVRVAPTPRPQPPRHGGHYLELHVIGSEVVLREALQDDLQRYRECGLHDGLQDTSQDAQADENAQDSGARGDPKEAAAGGDGEKEDQTQEAAAAADPAPAPPAPPRASGGILDFLYRQLFGDRDQPDHAPPQDEPQQDPAARSLAHFLAMICAEDPVPLRGRQARGGARLEELPEDDEDLDQD